MFYSTHTPPQRQMSNLVKSASVIQSVDWFVMNTTRRRFVTGLAAPLILEATDKAGTRKPILGEGAHKYEVTHDWGELPASIKYGNTHGVCEDSHGRIYIHHTVNASSESSDSMVVFDHKGKFIKSWGKEFKGGAHGLHIRKEDG